MRKAGGGVNKWRFAFSLIGIGWYVALAIVLGAWLGWWLDRRWGTLPILSLAGVSLGTFVAMYGVWRMLRPGLKKPKEEPKKE